MFNRNYGVDRFVCTVYLLKLADYRVNFNFFFFFSSGYKQTRRLCGRSSEASRGVRGVRIGVSKHLTSFNGNGSSVRGWWAITRRRVYVYMVLWTTFISFFLHYAEVLFSVLCEVCQSGCLVMRYRVVASFAKSFFFFFSLSIYHGGK